MTAAHPYSLLLSSICLFLFSPRRYIYSAKILPRNRRLTDFQARLVACAQTFCYIESVETTAQKERQRKKDKEKRAGLETGGDWHDISG